MTDQELIQLSKQAMEDLWNSNNGKLLDYEQTAYNCLRLLCKKVEEFNMTLPFNIKSITIENTGFNSDGDGVNIVSIDKDMCELEEPIECVYDGGGYTLVSANTEFPWSFTKKDITANPYVLIQLQ